MMSKKWTFSLTSLITILALAFVVTPAMAFDVTFDGPTSVTYTPKANTAEAFDDVPVSLTIKTGQSVSGGVLNADATVADLIKVYAFDKNDIQITGGATLALKSGTIADTASVKKVDYTITITPKAAGATSPIVAKVVVQVSELTTTNPLAVDEKGALLKSTMKTTTHTITVSAGQAANPDRPQVVSIQRLRPGSQTVVAAFQEAEVTDSFHVRIVLTEAAASLDLKNDKPGEKANAEKLVKVEHGTVSDLVIGEPFSRQGGLDDSNPPGPDLDETVHPHPIEGDYYFDTAYPPLQGLTRVSTVADDTVPLPSGTDSKYHQYRVKVTPHRRATSVIVTVKAFHDKASPYNNYYQPDVNKATTPNGREKLDLKVNIPKPALEAGFRVYLPHIQKPDFPASGHYILTRDKNGSHINYSNHEDTDTPDRENKATEQTLAQLKYNVRQTKADTPGEREVIADEPQEELPNLEAFLANQGTIHLVSYVRDGANPKFKMGDLYISEVMWGTDASQEDVADSNWIEIRNTKGKIDVNAQDWALWFYEAHETPPTAYPANSSYEGAIGQPGEIIDIIGTKASDTGLSWSLVGKGKNGRSGVDKARADQHIVEARDPLISMYRVMNADGTLSDGTMADSWMQTPGPSVNLKPGREDAIIATPGAAPFDTPDTLQAEKDKQKAKEDQAKADQEKIANTGTYPKAGQGRVYISEIMFAGGGTLPQWIEIANGDRSTEFNLSGWTITVDNAAADADVDVASATFTIPKGTTIDPSAQHDTPSTILVVTEQGRNNLTGAKASGQVINLAKTNEVDLITAGVLKGKYTLLSDMAFQITLAPPVPEATKAPAGETAAAKATRLANEKKETVLRKAATDMVGNLGRDGSAAWALPMSEEGGRSSIIRTHEDIARGPAAPEPDGMMEGSWTLASDTAFADVTHIRAQSYYGAASDVGTPGFRAGGALPVELSHFRPARDKATGQVVITWATQSELNNAGFFIKRSQQRDGEFKVINATMIAGAGTTSEKQFYTYTDTTAQPNVVYYYQIEDVSLDGNRQTLTRGIRLKGHVGAAGKATTLWGELKTSHE